MTLAYVEGFDMYNGIGVNTGLQAGWNVNNTSLIGVAGGRFGGQSLITTSIGSGAPSNPRAYQAFPTTYSSFATGFAFLVNPMNNLGTYLGPLFQVHLGGTAQMHIALDQLGALHAFRSTDFQAGTDLGHSANGVIVNSTWQYIEVEVVISTSVGRVTIFVDGASVLNLTGVNTQNAGSALIDTIYFCSVASPGQPGMSFLYDDWYFNDTATRLGEARVETLRPTSDSSVAWTPNSGVTNYSRVNETVVDGDTSYVSTATIGARDLYGTGGLSSTPAGILGVQAVSFAEKTDATTRQIYNSVRSASTDSDGTAMNLSASYRRFNRLMNTDPATSAAWTATGVNNLLIGPKAA